MARVQFELPSYLPFATDMTVYFSHINPGNHLDNAQLLSFVTEARVRFFRWLGYVESDVEGCSLPVGDVVVQYVSEGFYGDTLRVHMVADDFSKYGFDLIFRVVEKDSGRDIARGKCGMVFLDKQSRKVTPVPPGFRERLRQYGAAAECAADNP